MTKNKYLSAILACGLVLGNFGCKDQLDVGNPNSPQFLPKSEPALEQLAAGGVYLNGFSNGDGWLGNSYFSLPMGYNELLADNVGASASNNQVTTVAQPDYIQLSNGDKVINQSPSVGIIRTYNTRASTGGNNNAIHYEWLNMYAMNNAMNLVLSLVDDMQYPLESEAAGRKAALKAWCYFWKGYAYQMVGSKYYSGLIINTFGENNADYLPHDQILTESNKWYDLAATTIDGASDALLISVWSSLIPPQNASAGHVVPTKDEFKRNINTLKARALLFNKLSPFVNDDPNATISGSSMSGTMTGADWTALKTLLDGGIQQGDWQWTGRTIGTNDWFTASGGHVAVLTANPASTATFKPTERLVSGFHPDDKRFLRNFDDADTNQFASEFVYGSRYSLLDHGLVESGDYEGYTEDPSLSNAWIYATSSTGDYELAMAGTWEENALMLAEYNIRNGNIEAGLGLIDQVRDFMGADVAPSAGNGFTLVQALNELAMERRAALLFRGLSFYDSRRWGWTYDVSKGGGSYHQNVWINSVMETDVLINYNFMDYWDVPANEAVLNPPTSGDVKNPNF